MSEWFLLQIIFFLKNECIFLIKWCDFLKKIKERDHIKKCDHKNIFKVWLMCVNVKKMMNI